MQQQRSVYLVQGMCCAEEQRVIEKRLRTVEGIESYSFNLVARKLYITHTMAEEEIPRIIKSAGFTACPVARTGAPPLQETPPAATRLRAGLRAHLDTLAALVLTAVGIVGESRGMPEMIAHVILGVAIVWGGARTARKAWAGVRTLTFDMNVLMSAAVIGAVAIGRWGEGAAVIALFALSQLLEELSMARTRRAISSLIESAPRTASVVRDGVEYMVTLPELDAGDRVKVRPGEKIPADGVVFSGHSSVNESAITGESMPALKIEGSRVFAGTLNERGTLEVTVEHTGDDTTMARIIHLVEQAQAQRAPAQRFIERFAAIYSPAVLALAALVAVVPPLLFDAAAWGLWFYRSLVLLVIACPCALVISTPVTIISGLTAAARNGILIKGGRFLEESAAVRAIAFDKTGTLTYGTPSVTDIHALDGVSERALVRLAALGEQHSEHVLADAIMRKAEEMQLEMGDDSAAGRFESFPGKGISIAVDGVLYLVGSPAFIEEQAIDLAPLRARILELEREGKTVICVGTERGLAGVIAVADVIREESREALASFASEGIEHTVLLSGDNTEAARSVARLLGMKDFRGALLPEQKVEEVRRLRERYGRMAMVGDGINDAPALASASVGIAIGGSNGGTDVAMETADIVLLKNDLRVLKDLFAISRRTMRVLKQNIAIALAAKAVFLLLAVAGVATLWMAVVADDGVTLLVVMNALRLLKKK